MKLRESSALVTVVIVVSLTLSLFSVWRVYDLHQAVIKVQQNRQEAMRLVYDLRIQTYQLSKLVRAYIATSEPRYLMYYYDLLGIRQGDKAPPKNYDPSVYWDLVMAGKIAHYMPIDGKTLSIAEQMQKAGFSKDEIATLRQIFAAADKVKNTEQIAFAATQGLYDVKRNVFVEDGKPDNMFAEKLVYGHEYRRLNADMSVLIGKLISETDARTLSVVEKANSELKKWITLSILFSLLTVLVTASSLFFVRRMVLKPIQKLTHAVKNVSSGDYHVRVDTAKGAEELNTLAVTFNAMASDIAEDIAIREKTHIELEEAKKIAEDATKAKSMFLANMSHEIRTPMNAIIGMTYLALKTNLTTKQREYIDQVNFAANSLLGIINDILDFSKVEAGKLILESMPFSLKEILDNVAKMQTSLIRDKGLEFIFETNDAMLLRDAPMLSGDRLRLGQIITNLLSNAIKFTERGFVELAVSSHRDGETVNVKISIKDSGIGMNREQVSKLFQEFSQADASTSRKYGGTGLGLAISKNLTELMGGKIYVNSKEGEGSEFCVEIPFRLARADEIEQDARRMEVGEKELEALKKMRVLLVEDNQINQKLAVALLRDKNVRVEVVENGKEAIDKLASVDIDYFDAVLMDLQMPILDGYEATVCLRANNKYDTLPIIAMTAHVMSEEVQRCKTIGMQDYIGKPVEPDLLYSVLAKYSKNIDRDAQDGVQEDVFYPEEHLGIGDINGLDTKAGIKHAGGDAGLYIDILRDFVKLYGNSAERFEAFFENRDNSGAMKLAHSLKGLLGTIGSKKLYDVAADLEHAFMQDGDAISAFNEFKQPFKQLIADTKDFLSKIGD